MGDLADWAEVLGCRLRIDTGFGWQKNCVKPRRICTSAAWRKGVGYEIGPRPNGKPEIEKRRSQQAAALQPCFGPPKLPPRRREWPAQRRRDRLPTRTNGLINPALKHDIPRAHSDLIYDTTRLLFNRPLCSISPLSHPSPNYVMHPGAGSRPRTVLPLIPAVSTGPDA